MLQHLFHYLYLAGLVLFFLTSRIGFAQPFNEVISFGDSLTDVGNVAGLTIPGNSPVINGYYLQTHFSDNIIWIETLANYWGLPARTPGRGSSTSLPPQRDGNDWAWGGSEAAAGSVQPTGVTEPIPNLLSEVVQYLETHKPDPNTLYSIWSGADNLLIGGKFGPKAAKKAVSAVKEAVRRLEAAGARNFIIFNMPKLGDTPSAQSGGRIDEFLADVYSHFYNKDLDKAIKKLRKKSKPDTTIYFVDIFREFVVIVDTVNSGRTYTPRFFVPGPPVAINNVKDEALNVFNATGTFPTNYLFWDDVHPTTQGHQVVAGLVLRSISARP